MYIAWKLLMACLWIGVLGAAAALASVVVAVLTTIWVGAVAVIAIGWILGKIAAHVAGEPTERIEQ